MVNINTQETNQYIGFLFLVCILYIYVIPYNLFSYNLIVLPVIGLVGTLSIMQKNEKYSIKTLLLLSIFFGVTIIKFDYLSLIMFLSITLFYFIFNEEKEVSGKLLKLIYWIAIIGIISQLSFYRTSYGRIVLSVMDPNFSGLLMLLFFYFCNKNNFKLGKILSLVSIVVLGSRNYLLAIIAFYIIRYAKNRGYKILKGFSNFAILLLFGGILILLLSNYWVSNVVSETKYITGAGRLFQLNDSSNLHRFYINTYTYNLFLNDKGVFLWGLKDSFDIHMKSQVGGVPHNSVLYFIAKYGAIYSIFYFSVLSIIIKKYFKSINYEYIYSYLIFSLFLHATYSSIIILFFILIISIKPRNILEKGII